MENYSKYLCIFGGGAVRGYTYLGVLKAFEEFNFRPQQLAGSSVGAVIAGFYAIGMDYFDISKVICDVNFELFKDINLKFTPAFAISKGEVFLNWLRENIEKFYYKEDYKKGQNSPVCFKDLDRDFFVITTDLTNSCPFIFSKQTTPNFEVAQAIRASASMPGLLSPVEYEGKLLTDGDLMKSNPMWKLNPLLNPEDLRILELRLEGVSNDNNIKNLFDYFNKIYSCITNYSTDFIIDMYSNKDKFDYIKIDTKDLILVNFNIKQEIREKLFDIGYETTTKFFKEDLPNKRANILGHYSSLLEKIELIENCIDSNDLRKTKKAIGDIFEVLSDIKKTIDYKILKKIKKFRNLFNDNLTCGIFGKEKLTNKKEIKASLNALKMILLEKCNELEEKFI